MIADFERFTLRMSKKQARAAYHQGACDDDVVALLRDNRIRAQLSAIGPDAIAAELATYGAWDADQLADPDDNHARIVWIAAANICDDSNSNR